MVPAVNTETIRTVRWGGNVRWYGRSVMVHVQRGRMKNELTINKLGTRFTSI